MGGFTALRKSYLIYAFLIAITLLVYWQTVGFDLVGVDDDVYVTQNPLLKSRISPGSLARVFTQPYGSNWIPLVWITYMVDSVTGPKLFSSNPAGSYHLTNVLLHVLNVLLLFTIMRRLTGSAARSAFVAAIFAVHPLHVESVAWVTERKDVLSALFWMLTILVYIRYVAQPRARTYILMLVIFALGLMSKSMLVTLPIVLLMLDHWPLRRMAHSDGSSRGIKRLVLEKVPLLVLAAADGIVTLLTQTGAGAVKTWEVYPLGVRIANAVVAYISYIGKTLYPTQLAFLYPHPGIGLAVWVVAGSALLLLGLTAAAVWACHRRPYVFVGWLWFVLTLLPTIGLIQVGSQAFADRYTYIPMIGLSIVAAWGVPDMLAWQKEQQKTRKFKKSAANSQAGPKYVPALALASALLIALLAGAAHTQAGYWRDGYTLSIHALQVNPNNAVAHFMVGARLADNGDMDGAIEHYRDAVGLKPDYIEPRHNLAVALAERGQVTEAISQLRELTKLDPDNAEAHNSLGIILAESGSVKEAISEFSAALRINPRDDFYRKNLEAAKSMKNGGI